MASPEAQSSQEMEKGKWWRNIGLGILAVGLLGEKAIIAAGGALIAASGEIYRRTNKSKQK